METLQNLNRSFMTYSDPTFTHFFFFLKGMYKPSYYRTIEKRCLKLSLESRKLINHEIKEFIIRSCCIPIIGGSPYRKRLITDTKTIVQTI